MTPQQHADERKRLCREYDRLYMEGCEVQYDEEIDINDRMPIRDEIEQAMRRIKDQLDALGPRPAPPAAEEPRTP